MLSLKVCTIHAEGASLGSNPTGVTGSSVPHFHPGLLPFENNTTPHIMTGSPINGVDSRLRPSNPFAHSGMPLTTGSRAILFPTFCRITHHVEKPGRSCTRNQWLASHSLQSTKRELAEVPGTCRENRSPAASMEERPTTGVCPVTVDQWILGLLNDTCLCRKK
ncbi:hypothetical protein N658DRAFT_496010 [Parathielavia hyrcaniae]|uniref:Uncharacterized protein n=1 Tax=Parathielavia hyrcaniae TaxID=113614 RepID=A0AAN6Q0Y4_9PEZI|nr:hypothetical protein N658DRAFT_496010 [Parathielavia hyrcaniae]